MSVLKKFEYLKIPLEDILLATNTFSKDHLVGKGGFGKVYKGELVHPKGHTTIAVKRLDRKFGQGDSEFWKEVIMLSVYKHENIVSLFGFCDEKGEKILVYEYAPKQSLDLHLNSKDLTWVRRLKICIGAAHGLAYLHDPAGTQQRVLHRDIKSSNILLDENWNARIADFGLSKFGQQITFIVSNNIAGTIGYCDPQYTTSGILTKESDVYSFGVVLFEVLCGRLCIGSNEKAESFVQFVRKHYKDNTVDAIVCGNIKAEIHPTSLKVFSKLAYLCLKSDSGKRPLMNKIVTELETALGYQVPSSSTSARLQPDVGSSASSNLWLDSDTGLDDERNTRIEERSSRASEKFKPTNDLTTEGWNLKDRDNEVIIKQAEKDDEATIITINCPDRIGLGCDLCRTILFFGLAIVRYDVSTDEKWCQLAFSVIGKPRMLWSLLKKRLSETCPSISSANILYSPQSFSSEPTDAYRIKFCFHDRQGLLPDMIRIICELGFVIKRVEESTTPDGMGMIQFFVTDTREFLHTTKIMEDTHDYLNAVLGDDILSYEIEKLTHGPPSFIPPKITQGMFPSEVFDENNRYEGVFSVSTDNSLSPSHTLLQIVCHDHKHALYDTMRTLKDYNIQISYGSFSKKRRSSEIKLFIVQDDEKKITDPNKQSELRSRINIELVRPLRVSLVNSGRDTELLAANLVELSGKGRPMVLYDITLALKIQNIDVFSAEISRHLIGGSEWEVYRVLFNEGDKVFVQKGKIEGAVRKMLMGWGQ